MGDEYRKLANKILCMKPHQFEVWVETLDELMKEKVGKALSMIKDELEQIHSETPDDDIRDFTEARAVLSKYTLKK